MANDNFHVAPTLLQLCLTDNCQLKCKHCYFGEHRRLHELNVEQTKIILNKFFELRTYFKELGYSTDKQVSLNISGGEPLLNKDISKIITLTTPKFKHTKFMSNGLIYNKKICTLLNMVSNGITYQISLDGMKESHEKIRGLGTFIKTTDNIKRIKDDFPSMELLISFNANDINYKDVIPLAEYVKELGVSGIFFDRYVKTNNLSSLKVLNIDEYNSFISSILKAHELYNSDSFKVHICRSLQPNSEYVCTASVGNQIATSNGDRYVCSRYQIKSGNWFTDDINTLIQNTLYWESKIMNLPEECVKCDIKNRCRGGMRCLTYATTGSYNKKDIHCVR